MVLLTILTTLTCGHKFLEVIILFCTYGMTHRQTEAMLFHVMWVIENLNDQVTTITS